MVSQIVYQFLLVKCLAVLGIYGLMRLWIRECLASENEFVLPSGSLSPYIKIFYVGQFIQSLTLSGSSASERCNQSPELVGH